MPVRNSLLAAIVALGACLGSSTAWGQAGPATPGPQYQGAPFGNLGPFAAAAGGTMTSVSVGPGPCLTASPNPILVVGTITLQVPLSVPCGGTGDTTLTVHSVLLGEGVSPVAFAAPGTAGFILTSNGASADPSFQAVPAGGSVTSVSATTTPCLTTSPAPITTAGTVILQNPLSVGCGGTGDSTLTAHNVLLGESTSPVAFAAPSTSGFVLTSNGGSADPTFQAVPAGGTVTSVAETVPVEFTISGSPITTAGTLAIGKATETANTVWAGPTSGGAAQPTFRAEVCADLPAGGCPYDIAYIWNGVPPSYTNCTTPTDACAAVAIPRAVSCPVNLTASVGVAQEASTGTAVVNINQIHSGSATLRGTITFTSSATGVFASAGGLTIAAGDLVQLAFPTTADATLGDISVTLACSRT